MAHPMLLPPLNPPPLVIKLGGSALTHKAVRGSVNAEALAAAAALVATLWRAHPHLVVIHGAGSFGHFEAKAAGTHLGRGGAAGVAVTHAAVCRLSGLLVDATVAAGVAAVALPPLALEGTAGGVVQGVHRWLRRGFVPIIHGDVHVKGEGGSGRVPS
ncbi:hypothetical protein MMPV_003077 [Pyropia vietnamensis]